jgi:hypothetical protein
MAKSTVNQIMWEMECTGNDCTGDFEFNPRPSSRFPWVAFSRTDGGGEGPSFRAQHVLSFVCGKAGFDVADSIISLHDHKGILTVSSTRSLTTEEKAAFELGWANLFNEPVTEFKSLACGDEEWPEKPNVSSHFSDLLAK